MLYFSIPTVYTTHTTSTSNTSHTFTGIPLQLAMSLYLGKLHIAAFVSKSNCTRYNCDFNALLSFVALQWFVCQWTICTNNHSCLNWSGKQDIVYQATIAASWVGEQTYWTFPLFPRVLTKTWKTVSEPRLLSQPLLMEQDQLVYKIEYSAPLTHCLCVANACRSCHRTIAGWLSF